MGLIGGEPMSDYVSTMKIRFPTELNFESVALVAQFAEAIAAKLRAAEKKYGRADGWLTDDWEDKCREDLYDHAQKGDPLDVAIYAAFMWKRGWSTSLMHEAESV